MRKKVSSPAEKLSDREQLSAWCEWRKWCSIMRVRNPMPTKDEIAVGMRDNLDQQTRDRYYEYLSKLIFKRLTDMKVRLNDPSDHHGHVRQDWINEFDIYMRTPKKRVSEADATSFAKEGNYKDFVFYKASISSDRPLSVILGNTIGTHGYMMDVIKRRLNNEKIQKYANVSVISLDMNLGDNDDPAELYNMVAAEEQNAMLQDAMSLVSSLNKIEMVLWLAEKYLIALDSDAVHAATGLKKSALAERRKAMFSRIRREYPNLTIANIRVINFEIFEKLRTEKSATLFLNAIEGKESRQSEGSNDHVD